MSFEEGSSAEPAGTNEGIGEDSAGETLCDLPGLTALTNLRALSFIS